MGMTLEGVREILARMGMAQESVDEAMLDAFAFAGEYAVRGIRTGDMSKWNDQTGNLRSSVGYSVAKRGNIVIQSSFETVAGGTEGSTKGKEISERLAMEYSSYPYALIVVAGMEYAVYVEAIDNKVVLADGQLWLEGNVGKIAQARVNEAVRKICK